MYILLWFYSTFIVLTEEMATLLQSSRVVYQCSCEELQPLYNLLFCRHCSVIRCHICVSEEIDSLFCPHCLESNSVGEARVKKNRCANCNLCPICETVLSARSVGGASQYLVCNVCRWSTKESDKPENASAMNWPIHETMLDTELNQVMEKLRGLAAAEKATRDQAKSTKRRTMPSGNTMPDRFGLQAMYQRRKKAMENPLPQIPVHEPIEEIPPFNVEDVDNVITHPLDVLIRQPLAADKSLRPIRLPFKARRAIRCKECDHNIVKLDFGPCTIKYKVHYFARNHVPEIRLSREPTIVPGDNGFPVLLTVSNESDAKSEILLLPDPDSQSVEWITPMVQLALPPQDEANDVYDSHQIPESGEAVVFRRRHRAGIRLEVKSTNTDGECWLGLLLKFKNELCSTKQEPPEWQLTRVRVRL